MKLLHLSDLHLGKRLCDVSLLEDQAYILDQIAAIAAREAVDAVLIAGDVYDKGVPPATGIFKEEHITDPVKKKERQMQSMSYCRQP